MLARDEEEDERLRKWSKVEVGQKKECNNTTSVATNSGRILAKAIILR